MTSDKETSVRRMYDRTHCGGILLLNSFRVLPRILHGRLLKRSGICFHFGAPGSIVSGNDTAVTLSEYATFLRVLVIKHF